MASKNYMSFFEEKKRARQVLNDERCQKNNNSSLAHKTLSEYQEEFIRRNIELYEKLQKLNKKELAQGFEQIRSARDEIKQKIEEITKWIDIGWKKLHEIEHEVDRDSVYSAQKLEEINSYLNTVTQTKETINLLLNIATGYKRSNIRAKLKRKKPRKEGNQLKRSKNELELQKSEEEMYETIVQEFLDVEYETWHQELHKKCDANGK